MRGRRARRIFDVVAHVYVGTSGYDYPHFRGVLYPEGVPRRAWLSFYATRYPAVELNATFYRLPSAETVRRWRDATPPGFRFVAKGSRFLTHMKRLLDPVAGLRRYFERLDHLGDKLAIVLWQLPPQLAPDPPRLARFLDALPTHVRHAVELRSGAWNTDEVLDLLDARGVAVCEHDLAPLPPRLAGGFRYLRFHGASGPYRGRYGAATLSPWAASLRRWSERGREAWVFFNNDTSGHAVRDADALLRQLGGAAARPAPAPAPRRRRA